MTLSGDTPLVDKSISPFNGLHSLFITLTSHFLYKETWKLKGKTLGF